MSWILIWFIIEYYDVIYFIKLKPVSYKKKIVVVLFNTYNDSLY